MKLKKLKKGAYFTLKEIAEPKRNQVFIKGEYNKTTKSYSCIKFDDINNEKFVKANKDIYTDFTF